MERAAGIEPATLAWKAWIRHIAYLDGEPVSAASSRMAVPRFEKARVDYP